MIEEKENKKSLKELKNMYKLVKQDKWKLLAAFICILISSIFGISNGYLQGEITESIIALKIKNALLFNTCYNDFNKTILEVEEYIESK